MAGLSENSRALRRSLFGISLDVDNCRSVFFNVKIAFSGWIKRINNRDIDPKVMKIRIVIPRVLPPHHPNAALAAISSRISSDINLSNPLIEAKATPRSLSFLMVSRKGSIVFSTCSFIFVGGIDTLLYKNSLGGNV